MGVRLWAQKAKSPGALLRRGLNLIWWPVLISGLRLLVPHFALN